MEGLLNAADDESVRTVLAVVILLRGEPFMELLPVVWLREERRPELLKPRDRDEVAEGLEKGGEPVLDDGNVADEVPVGEEREDENPEDGKPLLDRLEGS